jgi:hypothetical protein
MARPGHHSVHFVVADGPVKPIRPGHDEWAAESQRQRTLALLHHTRDHERDQACERRGAIG